MVRDTDPFAGPERGKSSLALWAWCQRAWTSSPSGLEHVFDGRASPAHEDGVHVPPPFAARYRTEWHDATAGDVHRPSTLRAKVVGAQRSNGHRVEIGGLNRFDIEEGIGSAGIDLVYLSEINPGCRFECQFHVGIRRQAAFDDVGHDLVCPGCASVDQGGGGVWLRHGSEYRRDLTRVVAAGCPADGHSDDCDRGQSGQDGQEAVAREGRFADGCGDRLHPGWWLWWSRHAGIAAVGLSDPGAAVPRSHHIRKR